MKDIRKLRNIYGSNIFSAAASLFGVAAAILLRFYLNVSPVILAIPLLYLMLLSYWLKKSIYPLAGAALWCFIALASGLAGEHSVFSAETMKIVLSCVLLSVCSVFVSLSGGTAAVARFIATKTQTRRGLFKVVFLVSTLFSAIPEIGAAVSGSLFSDVSKKMGISAEKLSLVAGISACLIGNVFFFSLWTAGSSDAVRAGLDAIGGQTIPAFDFQVTSIQYNFFALSMLVILIMSVFNLRDMGGIYEAESTARTGFRVKQLLIDVSEEEQKQGLVCFAVPFAVFLAILALALLPAVLYTDRNTAQGFLQTLHEQILALPWGNALLLASMTALVVSVLVYRKSERKPSVFKPIGSPDGKGIACSYAEYVARLMISLCAMVCLCNADFYSGLAQWISLGVSTAFIPMLCFAVAILVGLISGSFTVACVVVLPLAISVCWLAMPEQAMYYTMGTGAVFSGALAGVLLSPCAAVNIIAAISSGCSLKTHMRTQAQYVLLGAVLSCVFGFFPLSIGFGTTFGLVLVTGASYAAYDCLSKNPDRVKK